MERLTTEYCGEYMPEELCSINRFGEADDCDLCCEYCKATEEGNEDCSECAIKKCFNKLGKYESLEKQGRLIILPCEIGQRVYRIYRFCEEAAYEIEEHTIRLEDLKNIGKTVFLTKEEAEQALKGQEGVEK